MHITLPLIRPAIVIVVILRMMTALSAFAAIFAATGGGPGTATEILNLYAYRTSFTELNLGYGAALAVVLLVAHHGGLVLLFRMRRAMMNARAGCSRLILDGRAAAVRLGRSRSLWALLTSFKTERDVLAYPPTVFFEPTLANYREVLFGATSILPNLISSTDRRRRRDAVHDADRGAGRLRARALRCRPSAPAASTCSRRRCCRRSA